MIAILSFGGSWGGHRWWTQRPVFLFPTILAPPPRQGTTAAVGRNDMGDDLAAVLTALFTCYWDEQDAGD